MPLGPFSPFKWVPAFSPSSAPLDLFLASSWSSRRRDSLWKAHGILLLVYMENTREARRTCTMQMIPRYGLFIVSHLCVHVRYVLCAVARDMLLYCVLKAPTCLAEERQESNREIASITGSAMFLCHQKICDNYYSRFC